jgi:hypothetical protein
MTPRYVLPRRAAELTGYTVSAIEHKIERGVWREGREYRIAPDGYRLIDMQGYEKWVEGESVSEDDLLEMRMAIECDMLASPEPPTCEKCGCIFFSGMRRPVPKRCRGCDPDAYAP